MEFEEWDDIVIARKIRGFKISGIFMLDLEWTITNNDFIPARIPGVRTQHSLWFNDKKDVETYDILIDAIKRSVIDWTNVK